MKKLLCALIALAMIFSLAACGGAKEEPATYNDAGYYGIFSITEDGETMTQDTFQSIGWNVYLQLNDDGTGVLDLDDGDVTELTWQDGTLTAEGDTISYILAGGMLTLDLSDDDGEFVMIFQKGERPAEEDTAAANIFEQPAEDEDVTAEDDAPAPETEATEPIQSELVGTYKLVGMDDPNESVTTEDLEMLESLGLLCQLVLTQDGAGQLVLFGEAVDLSWDDTSITAEGEAVPFTYDNGTLTLAQDGTTLVFSKIDDEAVLSTDGDAPAEPAEPTEVPAVPTGDFTPVGGDVGDYHVEIVGAEAFTDSDGKDAVRFYYDFTNNSDSPASAWLPLSTKADEDGYELVTAYSPWDAKVPEYGNEDLNVQPGASIRCVKEFSFQPSGSVLTFTISDYGDDPVTAVFDAQALPGRPAEELVIQPILDPQFFAEYPTAAQTDNIAAEINDGNVTTAYDTGDDCLRVVFSVTNNTSEAASPLWLTTVRAYQDGVELSSTYTSDEDGQEDAYYNDVAPGETTYFAYAWALRSDSPVEVTLQDYTDYGSDVILAGTFTLE